MVLITILARGAWRLWQSQEPSIWQEKKPVNLVVILDNEKTIIVNLSTEEKKLSMLSLPETLYLAASGNFGDYPLSSIYHLGEIEGKGGKLLSASLENFLGIPIDGFISSDEEKQIKSAEEMKKFLRKAMIKKFSGKLVSNLSLIDLGRLWWFLVKETGTESNFFDLAELGITGEKTLADETKVLTAEKEKIDFWIKKIFGEKRMAEEGIEIEIINGTQHESLAANLARSVTNLGGRIVSLGNSDGPQAVSLIRYSQEKIAESYTLARLVTISGFCIEKKADLGTSRSQVQIILGEDYWRKLNAPW